MTDLEMTKRCAEKMGHPPPYASEGPDYVVPGGSYIYQPLKDDAQAMALVKKLGLDIAIYYDKWVVWQDGLSYHHERSANSDLNRAIVECVARLP